MGTRAAHGLTNKGLIYTQGPQRQVCLLADFIYPTFWLGSSGHVIISRNRVLRGTSFTSKPQEAESLPGPSAALARPPLRPYFLYRFLLIPLVKYNSSSGWENDTARVDKYKKQKWEGGGREACVFVLRLFHLFALLSRDPLRDAAFAPAVACCCGAAAVLLQASKDAGPQPQQ
ncbi:hypothetical protein SKAU_G00374810 [Synaphobranchus kaupii]|uniref:Uncharacterized protein n=1 Tax=Synaphobranchus kaupii TaxID=118154 RepID=A0A9Q1EGR4_SYNKA|nr:hypothetical protein SKAU_G00374810 [Synaphobranchus kaupii]